VTVNIRDAVIPSRFLNNLNLLGLLKR